MSEARLARAGGDLRHERADGVAVVKQFVTAAPLISTHDAYERWAPTYPPVAHNPLMRAEQDAMIRLWPDVAGLRSLDLACGTGRYAKLLADSNASQVVALDFSAAMLSHVGMVHRVRASMLELPFAAGSFHVIVSGLAAGHAPDIHRWMAEIARVLKPGGVLLYSDFHPEAARAGHSRKFTDEHQRSYAVPHHNHSVVAQRQAAAAAGLNIEAVEELRAGHELCEAFPQSEAFYRRWSGWPFVLVVRARKASA